MSEPNHRFPLRPLRSERDYYAAAAVLDAPALEAKGRLDRGEADYFDALTILVEEYDHEHCVPESSGNDDPREMLKFLMDEGGMTQADLGRLLGNRALASLILNRHRALSKSHILKLATYCKVSPALFLGPR